MLVGPIDIPLVEIMFFLLIITFLILAEVIVVLILINKSLSKIKRHKENNELKFKK